ncbi:hypothetical protein ACI797_06225 [Geodermatophilus sp. SYSU D00691]
MSAPPVTPAAGLGGLVRAEAHRFRARRFIQVLLGLLLLGWLTAVLVALPQFGQPTADELAAARQLQAENVTASNEGRAECLADPDLPDDVPPEEFCGPPITAEDLPLGMFLEEAPFSFVAAARAGALGFAAAAAVLAFLLGATWIGAEWSTRSIVALLFWEPRRYRVMGVKLGVLAAGGALLGVLAQAAWLAMAGILSAVAGDGAAPPEGFWSSLLALQGRAVVLTVLAALAGFGLANLVRNTGAALGAGFVYFAVLETAIRALRPTWQPWLLTNNAVALVNPGGLQLFLETGAPDENGFVAMTGYVVGNLQGGLVLGGVTAALVVAGVVLFARRDLH